MTDSGAKKIAQVEPWMQEVNDKIHVRVWNRIEECGYLSLVNICSEIDFAQIIAEHAPGVAPQPLHVDPSICDCAAGKDAHFFCHGDECRYRYTVRAAMGVSAPPADSGQVVINLARELYDRFVMGGWQPEDAYHQIRAMLGWPAAPKEGEK